MLGRTRPKDQSGYDLFATYLDEDIIALAPWPSPSPAARRVFFLTRADDQYHNG